VTRALVGALLALQGASCAEEKEGVLLCVDSNEPTGTFSRIQLHMTFAAEQGGPVCTPASVEFGQGALPYCIEVTPGRRFDELVVLRADGFGDGDILRARREVVVPFQPGRLVEQDVALDASCGDCAENQECRGEPPSCRTVPWERVFDGCGDECAEMKTTPCDPEHILDG